MRAIARSVRTRNSGGGRRSNQSRGGDDDVSLSDEGLSEQQHVPSPSDPAAGPRTAASQSGHFYVAENRTFLFGVDRRRVARLVKSDSISLSSQRHGRTEGPPQAVIPFQSSGGIIRSSSSFRMAAACPRSCAASFCSASRCPSSTRPWAYSAIRAPSSNAKIAS